jgi:murein DD-endopeptidase MepM/ murein hydrolase activator NlpD/urea transporter
MPDDVAPTGGLAVTGARLGQEVVWAGGALLRAFSQIVLSGARPTAVLLALAAAWSPPSLACGIACALAALATARAVGLEGAAEGGGVYGANALFLGLAVGHVAGLTVAALALALGLGALCAFVVAAGIAVLTRGWALPVLSVPAVALTFLLCGAAGHFQLAAGPSAPLLGKSLAPLGAGPTALLASLGALVFAPTWKAGLLVGAGLLWHSRIGFLLAWLAGSILLVLAETLQVGRPATLVAVFNGCLTAVALGGVWFVPSRSSFALALAGALAAGLVAWGLAAPWQVLGWPLSVLPFNAASLLFLVACRARLRDDHPKSVDFIPGTPEQNLAVFETRLRRGLTPAAPHAVVFSLPFQGEWFCTQGIDGALTHQGAWRHGFDFEIRDAGRSFHRVFGGEVGDYHCYALPVIAAADGTVVKVVSDVPDNAIGTINVAQNWGNLVLVWHAPGLYSLVAHLQPGSPTVREGQGVVRGQVLGACGNSGRSPRPHLHFQLQGTAVIGAPTLPCAFAVAVKGDAQAGIALRSAIPSENERWSNLAVDADSLAAFDFPLGRSWNYQLEGAGVRGWETISVEVDLFGETALASSKGRLAFRRTANELLTTTCAAAPDSFLQLVRMALPSVSMGAPGRARWRDWLPSADWQGRRPWWRDLLAPFVPNQGIEMEYRLARLDGGLLVVEGHAVSRAPRGLPSVRTRALWAPGEGLVQIDVATARGLRSARRAAVPVLVPWRRREETSHESTSGPVRAGAERDTVFLARGGEVETQVGPPPAPPRDRKRFSP